MDNLWLRLLVVIVSSALWRLGGRRHKWMRRYILPAALAAVARYRTSKDRSWITYPALAIAFSLGYGETHPYWHKFLAGVSWMLPRYIFLGFSPISIALPFIWIIYFKCSNMERFEEWEVFKWHWIEIQIGALVGASYAF